jgi:hypothetical protein
MAARRRTEDSYKREAYIFGSAARQLEAEPRHLEQQEIRRGVSRRTQENRRRLEKMNIRYVAFLAAATLATLAICVGYLKISAEVDGREERISRMETELKDAKADNDAAYNRVMKSVNLEEIRRIATEELHMVYASEDQVVFFDTEESDYVRQYEAIPDEEESGIETYLKN